MSYDRRRRGEAERRGEERRGEERVGDERQRGGDGGGVKAFSMNSSQHGLSLSLSLLLYPLVSLFAWAGERDARARERETRAREREREVSGKPRKTLKFLSVLYSGFDNRAAS